MAKRKIREPETKKFVICGIGEDGELWAAAGGKGKPYPVIPNRRIKPPLEKGDEFVGEAVFRQGDAYVKPLVRVVRTETGEDKFYGIVERRDGRFYLRMSEKNERFCYVLKHPGKARDGDFVSVSLQGTRCYKEVEILKNFGRFDLNKATASLILEKYDVPYVFGGKTEKELKCLPDFDVSVREDLTSVPLVTIDGDDSKDFDDAVWAERTDGGFRLLVAIADVSFYVRPGSDLDREAYRRGNSVYLPNMVIPMLPEKLSNELCSLQPQQKRAAVVCAMEIDKDGRLRQYSFKRAVVRSAARLTYSEVQKALDGEKSVNIAPVFKQVVLPLAEAYAALEKARNKRGALNLESDEIKVKVGKSGEVVSIKKAETYTSHKIVEEFMIAANVAAALQLKKSGLPIMYRVHDRPPEEKFRELAPVVKELGMKLPDIPALKPGHLNKILEKGKKEGFAEGINGMILRTLAQAQYSPENIGHFGLGLKDYVHFTSPIRRYADLLIHRALVKSCGLPDGGALEDEASVSAFKEIGTHLCETERKAVSAERDLTARFVSAYLQPSAGQDFEVKIVGLTTAGMFVRIDYLGAEGLIPLTSMPDDYYILGEGNLELMAERRGLVFRMGEKITARLAEASPITGGLIFKYLDPDEGDGYYAKGQYASRPRRKDTAIKSGRGRKKKLQKARKKCAK